MTFTERTPSEKVCLRRSSDFDENRLNAQKRDDLHQSTRKLGNMMLCVHQPSTIFAFCELKK